MEKEIKSGSGFSRRITGDKLRVSRININLEKIYNVLTDHYFSCNTEKRDTYFLFNEILEQLAKQLEPEINQIIEDVRSEKSDLTPTSVQLYYSNVLDSEKNLFGSLGTFSIFVHREDPDKNSPQIRDMI